MALTVRISKEEIIKHTLEMMLIVFAIQIQEFESEL